MQKAKMLAAKRSISISRLLAEERNKQVGDDEAYEAAHRSARDLMENGLHLGGKWTTPRHSTHRRSK
jgi:hypothetical protein